jgi:FMN hydrolase / 5-amino-6-(5-phospho-D-ribitylamino)uracil phosphatase
MHAIQLVSIDLFDTLVDVSTGRHTLWQTFLGETSTPARVEQAWALTNQVLFTALDQLNTTATYQSLRAVLQTCYTEVFARLQVACDPGEAARMAARYHAQRPWFPDAVPCLEGVRRRHRLCLASDADEAMLGEHVRQYPFDMCFTSERLQVYKGDAQNRFFAAIVGHYALAPEQMLHVGDTPAEIVAAQRVRCQTCWVNRTGRSWPHVRPPTYEVTSLEALSTLLGAAR